MAEDECFETYFEDAMKIHAICADYGLSENDARLLTYMHAKAAESGKGIDYFLTPAAEDAEALEIMLGQSRGSLRLPAVMSLDDEGQEALELILSISEKIAHLDAVLASECGLENRLSSELRYRLRLYRERDFRDEMIDRYRRIVGCNMNVYDGTRVKESFDRYRKEKERQEKELMQMAGIPQQ